MNYLEIGRFCDILEQATKEEACHHSVQEFTDNYYYWELMVKEYDLLAHSWERVVRYAANA